MNDIKMALVNARALAAVAEKLACDLEAGRLWPDDYTFALYQLHECLSSMPPRISG